jgi:undecaprenyl diphosphate synthase
MRQELRFGTIGRVDRISPRVMAEVNKTIEMSRDNPGMRLCLALDYGARMEIVDAIQAIAKKVAAGQLKVEEIAEQTVSDHLYTAGMCDPDLIVRTAGEMRISNFLLWQISYAELWVTQTFWPDFRQEHLLSALRDFAGRERRFGGLGGKG